MIGPIRVLVVDDHPIVRSGITSVLATQEDFLVVGEAADGVGAVRLAADLSPDIVLMDLRMPTLNGVDATGQIMRAHPGMRVVVLTTYVSDGEVLRAIEAGAVGYLLKDVPHDELFHALRAVARGGQCLAPAVTERLMAHWQQPSRATGTTQAACFTRAVTTREPSRPRVQSPITSRHCRAGSSSKESIHWP